ncbi:MAG TPA: hypothetical protein VNR88_07890 [Hyphomicrobium sp.]|nr:hypothetical protein [Hyphomicrobium sp.]
MARAASVVVPVAIAAVAGVLAWDLVRLIGEHAEAWDDPDYWVVGLPIMFIAAFVLGLGYPDRPWRWAVAIVATQALWSSFLALADGRSPNLFPLGLVTFAIVALACTAVAYTGRWARQIMVK